MSTAQQTNSKSDGPVHVRAVCIPMGPTLTLDSVIFAIECEIFETRAYMTEYSKYDDHPQPFYGAYRPKAEEDYKKWRRQEKCQ
ncbi:hypothetical protein GCK72_003338 [Caenorhabditis remanei]|uniref:Uncharacterized protein n=1 Tax=Caenorhabditis remanei TaxID=31234 RepID=A0A6A5HW80_CAERE|nr:hypothetical protein GCK72_003338 [Caenorhabditis remanei]KAF1771511.1 hypothetical protein GCK72_003338 [Caenorhabditis remanei]